MKNNHPHPENRARRLRPAVLILAGVLAVAALALWWGRDPATPESGPRPTFTVRQGPLTISVTEAGTIRPREQVILKSEVEGQTVILYLIEEGTQVEKGDLLVELDVSKLEDDRVNQQIQVINAEAALINARENFEVVKSQAVADVDQTALDLQFAGQDLEQYQEGEYPKQKKEAEAKITLAEETLTNAKNAHEWSRKLFAEKYLSETELKRDELAWQKARLDLELARDDLHLLENFTYKRRMAELTSNLKQTEMALERVKRKAAADVAQAEAKLKASEAEYRQQQDKLTKLETQITKTKIHAPMDGTVIYATSTKMSWRASEEPLDEGQAVRERQELIYLPTTASYNAEIKVHESSLDKIRPDMPVLLSIDALPGKSFSGRVFSIAPLPDPTSMFLNPDLKVYNTVIRIDANGGNGGELRNGMSCRAEIIVARYPEAIHVPVQAVLRVAGQPTVYVEEEGKVLPRPVTIGLDNNRMVRIIDGLAPGETVLLAPPLAAGRTAEAAGGEASVPAADRTAAETAPPLASPAGPGGAGADRGAADRGAADRGAPDRPQRGRAIGRPGGEP